MKHRIQFLALVLSLGMGACSSDETIEKEEQHFNNDSEIKEIVAVVGTFDTEGLGSRTTITMGESTIEKPVWAKNDTIGIYPTTGDQLSFPIVSGVGTSTCTFDGGGWALKSSTSYTAYSPFNRAYYYKEVDELPVSMLGQKQIGNGSTTHMGKYDLQIAKGTTPDSGKVKFQFQHQVCFVRMDLTAPIAATWKSITLESDALFTTEAMMDLSLETPTVTPTSTSNSIVLELEDVTTTSSDLSIVAYMILLPVDLTDKSLTITLIDSEDQTYTTEASITSTNHNFGAAKARWITADDFQVNIHIAEAGTLSSYIKKDNRILIESLKISGELNSLDFELIRYMAGKDKESQDTNGKLSILDLSDALIVDDDINSYLLNYRTSNDVIGHYMFSDLEKLTKIILPKTVTAIQDNAFFKCVNLINIEIPEGVSSIGEYAFSNCTNIKNISLPNALTTLGWRSFYNCACLTKIDIPNGITTIPTGAFEDCVSLAEVTMNENVTQIGGCAFDGCSKLEAIKLPENLEKIGGGAFKECISLKEINIPNGVTSIEGETFAYCN